MRSARLHAVPEHRPPQPDDRPPAGRSRRVRRMPAAATAVAMAVITLAVIGVSGGFASPAHDRGGPNTGTVLPAMPPLPWPSDGQASVEVEGVGSLGTKGDRTPVPIASVTKVMTAYVILQDHPLAAGESGPDITVDRAAAEESVSGDESSVRVQEGQRLTERQLLELTLIPSGNNIARLLARWDAGTQAAFVARMNRTATGLGMTHTLYTGASGFEPTTRSTAVDQLKLARRAMRNETLRSIVAEPEATVRGGVGTVRNTNTLLGRDGVIGLKTGSSTPAGGALMWAARTEAGGRSRLVLGVVLHQRAGTTPQQGLDAALDSSRELITAVRASLPRALAAHDG